MPVTRIAFVTGNKGKAHEAETYLAPLGINVDAVKAPLVEIQGETLREVAEAKLVSARDHVQAPFMIDDGGLFIEALNEFPGVYSAYVLKTLGVPGILRLMAGVEDRRARFRAVVGYMTEAGEAHFFAGECQGTLANDAHAGAHGFGFDPIFIPDGETVTFAEIPAAEKNKYSHRGKALAALGDFIADAQAR